MAASNAQVLWNFMACYATRDLDRMCGYLHPECVFVESGELPYAGEFHGPEGFRTLLDKMLGAYDMSFTDPEIMEAGERVVVRIVSTFVSRQSGASVTMPVTEIYSFTDGKISRADVFYREPGWVTQLHDR